MFDVSCLCVRVILAVTFVIMKIARAHLQLKQEKWLYIVQSLQWK